MKIDLKFYHESLKGQVARLLEGSELASGAKIGVWFRPESDCFVHILWWDSTGNVGRIFPNPELTDGSGRVKAGREYWLPLKGGERRWYVLDETPGYETVYFVASRDRNKKLEDLYARLRLAVSKGTSAKDRMEAAELLEREINLMRFGEHVASSRTAPESSQTKIQRVGEHKTSLEVAGLDAFFKLRFKHVER